MKNILRGSEIRCKDHPNYRGLCKPRESKRDLKRCSTCWSIYNERESIRQAKIKEFKEWRKVYHRNYRKINADRLAQSKKEYYQKLKSDGIKQYGGKCSCCGETIEEFLTLEHKNGRPKNEKRRTGKKMWEQVKSEGYPDDYTVLCFNCNCAKGAFGYCPHELIKEEDCNE